MYKFSKYLLLTTMLASAGWSAQAAANSQSTGKGAKSVWSVDCNNHTDPQKLTCLMQQTVFAGQTKTRIFSATIREVESQHVLLLALPHGLNLLAGVKLSIDSGDVQAYPIHTADVNGAYAQILLTDEMAARMRAGNILSLNVMASSENAIELQLSLAGFSSAYDLLQKF